MACGTRSARVITCVCSEGSRRIRAAGGWTPISWSWRSGFWGRSRITLRRPFASRSRVRVTIRMTRGSQTGVCRYPTRPVRSCRRPTYDSTTRRGSPPPRVSAWRTQSFPRKPPRRAASVRCVSRSSRRRPRTSTCSYTAARRPSGSTRRSRRGSSTSWTPTRTARASSRSWSKTRTTPAPPKSAFS